jgi:signal peptidase I
MRARGRTPKRQRRKSKRSSAWSIGVTILLVLLFRAFVAEAYVIPSGSMEPTLLVGDRLIANKAAFGLRVPWTTWRLLEGRAPQRGEVVIFLDPKGSGETLIKRVVAVAGETVSYREGRLHVNGAPLKRRHINGAPGDVLLFRETLDDTSYTIFQRADGLSADFAPVKVPRGHVFVLGDNRDDSNDSRYWGPLPLTHLKGKALAVIWSWGDGPRWRRFFSTIE